jgi:hypothetical protein
MSENVFNALSIPRSSNVTQMYFIVDLASYCEIRKAGQTALMKYLAFFKSVLDREMYRKLNGRHWRSPISLILNNLREFKKELSMFPFETYFPEFRRDGRAHSKVHVVLDNITNNITSLGGPEVVRAAKYIISLFDQVRHSQTDFDLILSDSTINTESIKDLEGQLRERELTLLLCSESGLL